MEDSEGTVRQIGAFSEGINNLTVSLCVNGVCAVRSLFLWDGCEPLGSHSYVSEVLWVSCRDGGHKKTKWFRKVPTHHVVA